MNTTKIQLIVNTFWAISTVIILFLDVSQDGAVLQNPNFLWGYIGCMVVSFIIVKLVERKIYGSSK